MGAHRSKKITLYTPLMILPGNGRGDTSDSNMVAEWLTCFSTTVEARVRRATPSGIPSSWVLEQREAGSGDSQGGHSENSPEK